MTHPWGALPSIFGLGPVDVQAADALCVFEEIFSPEPGASWLSVSAREYHGAVDRRRIDVVAQLGVPAEGPCVARIHGRQVGTLGTVIATGRSFSTLAHILVDAKAGSLTEVRLVCDFVSQLTGSGLRLISTNEGQRIRMLDVRAADRVDLLAGDPESTYWARTWRLAPRLARVALLLIAGLPPSEVARRLEISIKSARTYAELLFEKAGVSSRNELHAAILRAGRPPTGSTLDLR